MQALVALPLGLQAPPLVGLEAPLAGPVAELLDLVSSMTQLVAVVLLQRILGQRTSQQTWLYK